MKTTTKTGMVVAILSVKEDSDLMIVTKDGKIIRIRPRVDAHSSHRDSSNEPVRESGAQHGSGSIRGRNRRFGIRRRRSRGFTRLRSGCAS